MELEWQGFAPSFLPPRQEDAPPDLANLNTFGWRAQDAMKSQGIGFIHAGFKRYMVKGKEFGEKCVEKLWGEV